MKWKKPNIGDTKICRRFLLLPLTIKGETRWLEYAVIKMRYTTTVIWDYLPMGVDEWVPVEFID